MSTATMIQGNAQARREVQRRIERSAAAARRLGTPGTPVRVTMADGAVEETVTAGVPWVAKSGVTWVNVMFGGREQGCPCQAVRTLAAEEGGKPKAEGGNFQAGNRKGVGH